MMQWCSFCMHIYEPEHQFFLCTLGLMYCILHICISFPFLSYCIKELYIIAKDEYLMKKLSKYFLWLWLAVNFDVLKPLTQFLQGDALKQTWTSVRNAYLAKAELQCEAGANNNGIPFPAHCLTGNNSSFFWKSITREHKGLGRYLGTFADLWFQRLDLKATFYNYLIFCS